MRYRLLGLCLLFYASVSSADLGDDIWGVVTDPLQLGRSSNNVYKSAREIKATMIAATGLQQEIDRDIRFYLYDLDQKIDRIEKGVDRVGISLIEKTSQEVQLIEKKLMKDVKVAIRDAKCSLIDASEEGLKRSLREVFPGPLKAKTKKIRLPFGREKEKILWVIPTGGSKHKTIEIDLSSNPQPNVVFDEIEKAFITNIGLMREDDDAYLLVDAYSNLARYAKITQCFYLDQASEAIFVKKHAKYNLLVDAWLRSGIKFRR